MAAMKSGLPSVTDAPARHGVGLGKTVEENGALLHAGQGGESGVGKAAIGQIPVNFIRNDDEIVLLGESGNFYEIFFRHHSACRIIRVADEKRLRARGDVGLELLGRDAEIVFKLRRNGYGFAACECDAGLVGNIAGLGDQHFITGRENGAHGDIEGFADAYRDEHILCGIIGNTVIPLVVCGNFLAQLQHAAVCRVGGVALFQAVDAAFADGPRGDEIGFSDAEGDDVFHFGGDIEVFAYA